MAEPLAGVDFPWNVHRTCLHGQQVTYQMLSKKLIVIINKLVSNLWPNVSYAFRAQPLNLVGAKARWGFGTEVDIVMESTITWTKRDGQHHGFVGGFRKHLRLPNSHYSISGRIALCKHSYITFTERTSHSQNGHHRWLYGGVSSHSSSFLSSS